MASAAPWNAEEIRQNARSWTLEGDAKLLEFMQSISQNLETRATATTANIHRLGLNVDRTNVALGNITNQLSALQHSQFVENRVYEDDETIANVTEVPVEDQNKKNDYDPMETLNTVLKNSITMMERCYEKVSIEIEDSDEEGEPSSSVIYRPKNPYDNRPFPYIIGSKEWTEKRHIGICDSDDDYSGEENQDEFSESSENASISASLPSNAPTISESECSVWGLHGNPDAGGGKRQRMSSDEDLSSNIRQSFDDNKFVKGGVNPTLSQQHILPPDDPAVGRYYVHKQKQKDRGLFDESSDESTDSEIYNLKPDRKKSVPAVATGQKISNIFSDEPPDLDVVDKEEREPPVDLFYESGVDATVPVLKKEDSLSNNIRKKTVNLFDDDDFDSFMKELNNKTNQTLNKANATKKKARNLFDESSGEDESSVVVSALEAVKTTTKPISKPFADGTAIVIETEANPRINTNIFVDEKTPVTVSVVKPKPKEYLFDDESTDDLFTKPTTVQKDEVIASASLFNEEPSEEEFNNILPTLTTTKKTRITNLFDDEPPDDDFDSLFNTKNVSVVGQNKTGKSGKELAPGLCSQSIFDGLEKHRHETNPEVRNVSSRSIFNDAELRVDDKDSMAPKFSSRKIFDDLEKFSRPIPKARIHLSKANAPKLFSDDSDDSNLFDRNDTDEVESKKNALIRDIKPLPLEKDHDIVNAGGNITHKHLDRYNDYDANHDNLLNQTLLNQAENTSAPLKSFSNIFSDEFLDDENPDDLLESKSMQVSGVLEEKNEREPVEAKLEMMEDNDTYERHYFELPPALDDDNYPEASSLLDEKELSEKISIIEDEPSEKSTLTKTNQSSILDESNNRNKFDVASNEQPLKRDIFASTLFSDTPPDDDVLFDNQPNDADIIDDNALFSNTNSTAAAPFSSALNYNNVSLFHDIPPDDDFETSTHDTRKLHNIFYNDFSETIVPSQLASSKSISSYIFNEPPSDNLDSTDQSATSKNKLERTGSQSKVTALIDKVQKDIGGSSEKSVQSKPQPKKLNSNLSINVAALLPGTKRLPIKSGSTESSSPSLISVGDAIDETVRTVQIESDPSKLQSLNKTRAKIEVKRRPSTRKARQANYRRTLVLDEGLEVATDQNSSGLPKDIRTSEKSLVNKLSTDLFSDNINNKDNKDVWRDNAIKSGSRDRTAHTELEKSVKSSFGGICDSESKKLFAHGDPVLESGETITKKGKFTQKEKKTTSELIFADDEVIEFGQQPEQITVGIPGIPGPSELLFEDDFSSRYNEQPITKPSGLQGDNAIDKRDPPKLSISPKFFDDEFFIKEAKQTNKTRYRSFLDNDDEDEIFEQLQSKSSVKISQPTKNFDKIDATSIFFPGDDNHKVGGNKSTHQATVIDPSRTTETIQQSKRRSSRIFLDNDDNDDDLFTSAMTTTVEVQKSPPSLAEIRKCTVTEIPKIELAKCKPTKSQKISLFDDQYDDDDDLFDKNLKTGGKIIQTESKPIFGSDDDDGDDIFRSAAGKSAMKITESVAATTRLIRQPDSKSLFGDIDDDDDDLFGGSNTKNKNVASSSAPKKDGTKNSSSLSIERDFSDPLADLLNR